MQSLIAYLRSLANISEASLNILLSIPIPKRFKKGDYLLKENEVCNSLFFIEKGYCRSFYYKDGIEKNTAFHFEGEMVTNIASFGAGEKSSYNIRACESLSTYALDKHLLFTATKQAPEIEIVGKKCLQKTAANFEEHASLFKLYSPPERYEYIEKHNPAILNRVPLTQLSSYLGITRESLSRIRKRRL